MRKTKARAAAKSVISNPSKIFPGPGSYNPEPPSHRTGGFIASNTSALRSVERLPGPGEYTVYSSFSNGHAPKIATSARWDKVNLSVELGPGAYDIASDFDKRAIGAAVFKS